MLYPAQARDELLRLCTDAPVNDEDGDEDEDGQHCERSSNHIADVKAFTCFTNKEKRSLSSSIEKPNKHCILLK